MDKNRLFYGDNLVILREKSKIPDDSVDLCYIDPPFNSKRSYSQIYNNVGQEDRAQAVAFTDTWEWGSEAIDGFDYIVDVANLQSGKYTEQTVELIRGLRKVLGDGSLLAYLVHMTLRIQEIHRVLKSTGTFYLHCDPTASHYLKLVLDSVFCSAGRGGEFRNEIIWAYKSGGASKKDFAKKHDVIFRYCKSNVFTFNYEKEKSYGQTGGGQGGKVQYFKDEIGSYSMVGIKDWWTISMLSTTHSERLGYPTQKPEELIERIIRASSNEGDVVLDAYCGCGTTVAVAQRLNRRWIGIDITYQSISLILKRLQDRYPTDWADIEKNLTLDGIPRDHDSAVALANRKDDRTRKEFEKWSVLTFSDNQARINDKKGADGGIDGMAYFMIDADKNGKAVLQAKSGGVKRSDIATLNSDRIREGADFAFFVTLEPPSKPMIAEAKGVGTYKHPMFNREDDRVQIVTVDQILAGSRLNLPMARPDIVKSASPSAADPTSLSMFEIDS